MKTDIDSLLGFHDGFSIESYHAGPGLSSTGLKVLGKSLAHFKSSKLKPERKEVIGTLTHMRVLERELFESSVVEIAGHRGGVAVKEKIAEQEALGKFVIKPEEKAKVVAMSDAILAHPYASELFKNGVAERSFYWRDPATNVLLRCRPDYLIESNNVISDIKYFNNLSDFELERQIMKMKYHWSSALYLDGVSHVLGRRFNLFAHVFVEEPDFPGDHIGVRVVVLDDASLEKARSVYMPLLEKYAKALEEDVWPSYPEEITTVSLPSYAW